MSPCDRRWHVSGVLAAGSTASGWDTRQSEHQVLPERPIYEYLTPIAHKIQLPAEKSPLELVNPIHATPTLLEKSRPRLLTWSLLPQETATLIRSCQQAQTSVHAAICAAFLLAIAQTSHSQDDTEAQTIEQQPVILTCLTPINIRRFLTPPIQEDFGYYYIIYTSAHPIAPNVSLWDLAHAIKAQLNQKMSPDQIFAHLPEAQAFIATNPSAGVVREMFQEVYPYDVLISNFGQLHIPTQYGHLQLEAIYGSSLMTYFSNDPPFIGVATLGDQIFFNLVYSESNTSLAQIEHLQQEAMQLLYQEI